MLQFIRNISDSLLGRFRADRSGQLRPGGHQDFHEVLGHAYVRHLQRHQHRGFAQPTNCNDESQLPTYFG